VLLEQDAPAQEKQTSPYFLYYHERKTGNRWAIGRFPSAIEEYLLYFQPLSGPKVWVRFQQARLSRTDDPSVVTVDAIPVIESPQVTIIQVEPTCGD
jgi:hypothetical protein